MVIVEPGHFVGREERNIDGSEVDRAERCDVEREEFAELRGRSPAGDDQVFDAHAPVAGTVEAGFIGDEDACLETELARLRCTRGDVEGTFVDVEAAAHAVARAVSEVEALGPEGRACDGVELRARDACGNDGACKRDVGLEHERDVALHVVVDAADGRHAGDVGRARLVLPARVDEKKPVREDCGRFALRRIVWKRGVAAEGGDRAEAQAPVVGACGAF